MTMEKHRKLIEEIWENRELLKEQSNVLVIEEIIESLDKGQLRVAEPLDDGSWQVNDWVKKAVIMYFPTRQMEKFTPLKEIWFIGLSPFTL
jgi:2,3,4,5-tetrahydropyridine-2-carboxylate N-succinyltransferase